jgi:hypothetical protein
MATVPLVPNQIETVFQAVTCSMGLNLSFAPPVDGQFPTGPAPNPNLYGVRIGWEQQGQPFQQIDEDVVYIRDVTVDEPFNKIRYPSWLTIGGVPTKVVQYARIWKTFWTVYGPNSFDNARVIHSYLMTDEQTAYTLATNANLWLIPNSASPIRFPEKRDEQWWERADFSARFYELVTEQYPAGFITNAEVIVQDSSGVVAEIEIEGA